MITSILSGGAGRPRGRESTDGAGEGVAVETVGLVSENRAMDASLLSLSDAADVCAKVRRWFVVGGHMVNLHILRAGLPLPLRLTHDADIAVTMRTVRQGDLLSRIRALGYSNPVYSNRFDRVVDGLELSIDLLTASGTTKHHPRMDGYGIDIDGMPAVDEALDRDPVILDLRYERSDGIKGQMTVRVPDIASAIAMKTFAVAERTNPNDARDLSYLVQVAAAQPSNGHFWPRGKTYSVAKVQLGAQFVAPGSVLSLADESPDGQARLRELARPLVA
jgi:predicted nucleotidyltransferase